MYTVAISKDNEIICQHEFSSYDRAYNWLNGIVNNTGAFWTAPDTAEMPSPQDKDDPRIYEIIY